MRIRSATLAIIFLTAFCQLAFAQRGVGIQTVSKLPAKEKRWALIIGVDNYGLKGAVNDAKALKNALAKYAGFPENQIVLLTTDDAKNLPDRRNILIELDKLSRSVPTDGLFLFAFSGHGKTVADNAYLIPADGQMTNNNRLLRDISIDVKSVKEAVEEMRVKQVVMLIDACRDRIEGKGNESEPLTPAVTRGFNFDEANKSVEAFVTLYATRLGESAYEYFDKGTNQYRGYLSRALEEGLSGNAANEKGEVTLAGLLKYIEDTVPTKSYRELGKKQTPLKNTNNGYKENELVLSLAKPFAQTPSSSLKVNSGSGDRVFWQEIEKRNTLAAYQNYLTEYPNGEFSKIAKLRLANLKWEVLKTVFKQMLKYHFIGSSSEGLAAVSTGNKWGVVNNTGEEVIPLKYNFIRPFSEGLASVELNGKWGFIDREGNEIVPPVYDSADSFSEGLAQVSVGRYSSKKSGLIDKTGKVVIPLKYDFIESFSEGLTVVMSGNKYGFVDKTGKEITPIKYDFVRPFSEGLAQVKLNDKHGFIDKTGKEIIRAKFDFAHSFSEGLALVRSGDKYLLINKAGDKSVSLKYDFATVFFEGLAGVKLSDKYGFVDKTGRLVIQPKYDYVESFQGGIAKVRVGDYQTGKYGLIDKTGKEITPIKYSIILPFSDDLAVVWINKKVGFIDRTGKEIIPVKYDRIWCGTFLNDGFVGITLSDKKGFADIYGNEYFGF